MIKELKQEINLYIKKSIFTPNVEVLDKNHWEEVISLFKKDYNRYYENEINVSNVKYFPGLLATLHYRISRKLYLLGLEKEALEFSALGTSLTAIELYYSADIGEALKINHGVGLVIGSRTKVGNNCLFHQGVTIGEKNGGRANIGNNVVVYPNAVIVGDVSIGNNSIIGANAFVDKSCSENSKIF